MRQARLTDRSTPRLPPEPPPELRDLRSPRSSRSRRGDGSWTIEEAEAALEALKGVISARVVGGPGGRVQEVHLLATSEVTPKKTVRRVEAVFLTKLGKRIDHRTISVAQVKRPVGYRDKKAKSSASFLREPTYPVVDRPSPPSSVPPDRLSFAGHEIELDPSGKMRAQVFLETRDRRFTGKATGSQRARSRMTMLAGATLRAVEAAAAVGQPPSEATQTLWLDDVDVVDAFQRDFVIASVCSVGAHGTITHAGAAPVEESLDRAVINSTLQAAEPWLRESREIRVTRTA